MRSTPLLTGGGVLESGTDRARASGGPPILVRLPPFFLIVVLWKGCAGGAFGAPSALWSGRAHPPGPAGVPSGASVGPGLKLRV
jgi:hypothetical protein